MNSIGLVPWRKAFVLRLRLVLVLFTLPILPRGESATIVAMVHERMGAFDLLTAAIGRQVEFAPVVVETVLTSPDVDNEGATKDREKERGEDREETHFDSE